jgi:hypothetical protein
MKRSLMLAALMLLASQCGEPPVTSGTGGGSANPNTTELDLVSGSRLKAIRQKSPDGASQPYTVGGSVWWDSQLHLYCVLFTSSNTCLPIGPLAASGPDGATWFADSSCATPLLFESNTTDLNMLFPGLPAPGAPQYVTDFNGANVYAVGGAFSGAAYVLSGNGSCTAGGALQPGGLYYRGSVVPQSTFVQFTLAIDP